MEKHVDDMTVFGPVPSRRLGQSLGVQNVPSGTCTYDCVYCQLGHTTNRTVQAKPWYDVDSTLETLIRKETKLRDLKETLDYVTFVPNGEPTLDRDLELKSSLLRSVGLQTAIITNSSLIEDPATRSALRNFHRVIAKVDTVNESVWHRINRPHEQLRLHGILEGLVAFASDYDGLFDTETMLVDGLNDAEEDLDELGAYLHRLTPHRAYLSVAIRPPSEPWVRTPPEKRLAKAHAILSQHIPSVEYLVRHEDTTFVSTGDAVRDILAIIEVHPMRREAVTAYLDRAGATWDLIDDLISTDKMEVIPYRGETYYIRKHLPRTSVSAKTEFPPT